jgi:hypothetical protein
MLTQLQLFAGGYADCTNILQKPLVSAIGSIGLGQFEEVRLPAFTETSLLRQPMSARLATTPLRSRKTSLVSSKKAVRHSLWYKRNIP